MAKDSTFDIVSKVDLQEVTNAINQTVKEINQRFDLKGTNCEVEWDNNDTINIGAPDEMKLTNVFKIIEEKFIKRGISPKAIDAGKMEHGLGGTVKQEIKLRQGIERDLAKKINKMIKDTKMKVNSQVQGDQIRVTGKKRDDLQDIIKMLKDADLDIPLQFENFRS